MGPFFNFSEKRGSFQTLRAHKRWNTENNPITPYISEISIKFCVDWYIIWGILKIFEIFVFLMLAQNRVSPWGGQMDPKCSKNFSVSYLWYLYTRKKIAIQNSKKVFSWNTLVNMLRLILQLIISSINKYSYFTILLLNINETTLFL